MHTYNCFPLTQTTNHRDCVQWNNDTGELICRSIANYGTGTEVFNEANYIAIPPCIWGHQAGAFALLLPNSN